MLHTRGEIVDLVHAEAPELQTLLISIMWFASRGDSNLISNNRYGLLQVDLTQARAAGFTDQPNALLEPEINIRLGAQLLIKHGLVVFCGRELARDIPLILQLEKILSAYSDQQTIETSASIESARIRANGGM